MFTPTRNPSAQRDSLSNVLWTQAATQVRA